VNPNEMQEMLQRAQQMQSKVTELQAELATRRYEASAGGGMVTAAVSGALRVLSLEIEPTLIAANGDNDRAMIQDLTAAAVNAALSKAQEEVGQEMTRMQSSMLAGMPGLPGMGN